MIQSRGYILDQELFGFNSRQQQERIAFTFAFPRDKQIPPSLKLREIHFALHVFSGVSPTHSPQNVHIPFLRIPI